MISIDQALQMVLSNAQRRGAVRAAAVDALGMVLAEEIVSDVDSPPHDKAMMDGYAVREADLGGEAELEVIEEITAGEVPTKSLSPGQAARIMTGAPIPQGADAVVMIENTRPAAASRVAIVDPRVPDNRNIMRRAASLARGQTVLAAGTLIRPIEVGVLAEVGRTELEVFRRPSAAVMTTGNELVTPDRTPAAGQIRNSNSPMLVALARRAGAEAAELGIARDEEADIRRLVEAGLRHDVLVLSGGVSAGVLDLVPKVLAAAGVQEVFHKVNLKPGKPLWFGTFVEQVSRPAREEAEPGRSADLPRATLVFGLPGNPVSSLVCFELFVRAAIETMLGRTETGLPRRQARLASPFTQRGNRPVYFPAHVEQVSRPAREEAEPGRSADLPHVVPLPWQGSGDLSTLAQANGLIYFPAGEYTLAAGAVVDVAML